VIAAEIAPYLPVRLPADAIKQWLLEPPLRLR
jgi:hypothetical protein